MDDSVAEDSERAMVLVGYGLFLLAMANGITALIGVVIAYVRLGDARGTLWESHYRNMIMVFWVGAVLTLLLLAMAFTGLLAMMGAALGAMWLDIGALFALPVLGLWVPLALLACLMFGIWYLYRTLRGFFRALDGKAY